MIVWSCLGGAVLGSVFAPLSLGVLELIVLLGLGPAGTTTSSGMLFTWLITGILAGMEEEVKQGYPCFVEPGLIVVPEVTIDRIEKAVAYLWRIDYFSHLQPEPS